MIIFIWKLWQRLNTKRLRRWWRWRKGRNGVSSDWAKGCSYFNGKAVKGYDFLGGGMMMVVMGGSFCSIVFYGEGNHCHWWRFYVDCKWFSFRELVGVCGRSFQSSYEFLTWDKVFGSCWHRNDSCQDWWPRKTWFNYRVFIYSARMDVEMYLFALLVY